MYYLYYIHYLKIYNFQYFASRSDVGVSCLILLRQTVLQGLQHTFHCIALGCGQVSRSTLFTLYNNADKVRTTRTSQYTVNCTVSGGGGNVAVITIALTASRNLNLCYLCNLTFLDEQQKLAAKR